MSNIERVRTVEMIAAEINAIKDQTRNIFLYNSIDNTIYLCYNNEYQRKL